MKTGYLITKTTKGYKPIDMTTLFNIEQEAIDYIATRKPEKNKTYSYRHVDILTGKTVTA